ncbi:YigZ family protein [Helicobacter sp. T3_23-1056]
MQTISGDFANAICADCVDFTPNALSEIQIKGSKFLGFGVKICANANDGTTKSSQNATQNHTQNLMQNPQNPLQNALNSLRKSHPKAVHFVYAYRVINSLGQIIERSSDDGEPKGSSGMPCLSVLRGWEMVDFGIIVVRYFGGVKLGVGGLLKAYHKATLEALNTLKSSNAISSYAPEISLTLRIKYSELNALKYTIKSYNLVVEKEDFLSECVELNLRGVKDEVSKFSAWVEKNKHLFL